MKSIEEMKKAIAKQEAAVARVRARGISPLYPLEWEAAIREELGITTEEQGNQEQVARKAADVRLAKGEAALHAANLAAQKGALVVTVELKSAVGPRVLVQGEIDEEQIERALPRGWTVGANWQNGVKLASGAWSYPLVRKNRAAVSLGRRGGKAKSAAKSEAARANGKKGGRPRRNDSPR